MYANTCKELPTKEAQPCEPGYSGFFFFFEVGGGLISGSGQFTFIKSLAGIRYFKNKLHI